MRASWLWARALLRRHLVATLVLGLVAGLVAGLALAAVAAARRGGTAFARFQAYADAPDLVLDLCPPGVTEADLAAGADEEVCWRYDPAAEVAVLGGLPEVDAVVRRSFTFGQLEVPGAGPVLVGLDVMADPGAATAEGRPIVVAGRLPRPGSPGDLVVDESGVRATGLGVGARMPFTAFPASTSVRDLAGSVPTGTAHELEVVGVVRRPSDLVADVSGPLIDTASSPVVGPGWWAAHGADSFRFGTQLLVWARGGDVETTRQAVRGALAGQVVREEAARRGSLSAVDEAIRYETAAVAAFGAVLVVAWFVFVGQALARQVRREVQGLPALAAVGFTSRQAAWAVGARALPLAAVASVVAAALAAASSARTPVGLAGKAETSPGFDVDGWVVGLGVLALVAAVEAVALATAWAVARGRSREPRRAGAVAGALARLTPSPPAVAGVDLATSRRRGGVTLTVAALSAAVAVALVVAAATLAGSVREVVDDPTTFGVTWSARTDFATPEAEQAVVADPDVAGAALVLVADGRSGETDLPIVAFRTVKGPDTSWAVVTRGREPIRPGEVALGRSSLARLGAQVGDTVDLQVLTASAPTAMTVVGEALVARLGAEGDPGDGAVVDPSWLLGQGVGDGSASGYALRPASPTPAYDVLGEAGFRVIDDSEAPPGVRNLRRIGVLPALIVAVVAALALATLGHAIVLSVQRYRSQIAVLRALGFTRRQVSAAVAWQASLVAAAALVVGLPAGLVAGRVAWRLVAVQIGLVAAPVVPWAATAGTLVVTVLAANAVALVPGRLAGRRQPGPALRAE